MNFFFSDRTFIPPYKLKKNILTKKPLKYYSLKDTTSQVTNFTVVVLKMRVLGQKTSGGLKGGQTPPPSACLGLMQRFGAIVYQVGNNQDIKKKFKTMFCLKGL